jgi:2OG-Fe(II) oxygenase superfamily
MVVGVADPLADIPVRETQTPRGGPAASIFHVMSVVRPDECRALEDLFRRLDESGRTSCMSHSRRINSVYLGGNPVWERMKPGIFVPDGTAKIAARVSSLIQMENVNRWKFDIVPFPSMCITPGLTLDWQEAGGEGVPWHFDYTAKEDEKDVDFEPKLVAIVELSDPSDYEGGEFEVYSGTQIVRPEMEQGDMILFPSFLLHRRKPITRGRRFIMMTQAFGARWR